VKFVIIIGLIPCSNLVWTQETSRQRGHTDITAPTGNTATVPWVPAPGTTWQIQYSGKLNTTINASVYDVDLFDTSSSQVAALHAQGRKAVCYFSAGSYENWRPDHGLFPPVVIGKNNGWPGENWLDIRRIDLLGPIMNARLDLCKAKGFDAVDPDNVDGYTNSTGFPLSSTDQLAFNKFLASAAHSRGLSVALKNDLDQTIQLEPFFDFAVNEQCFQYHECSQLTPFINGNKAVFSIEYQGDPTQFCPQADALHMSTLKKHLSLDAWRVACP
jgi:hypothetical protein